MVSKHVVSKQELKKIIQKRRWHRDKKTVSLDIENYRKIKVFCATNDCDISDILDELMELFIQTYQEISPK